MESLFQLGRPSKLLHPGLDGEFDRELPEIDSGLDGLLDLNLSETDLG